MKFLKSKNDYDGRIEYDPSKVIPVVLIAVITLVFVLVNLPFVIVGPGQRGVVTNFGKVQSGVLDEGLHFRIPFVQGVKKISVRVQKNDVKAEAASKDLQTVKMDVVVNWHISPSKTNFVFQQIGDTQDVLDRIITPATNEVVKASSAKKNVEDIIAKRPELKNDIDALLEKRLTPYGIVLDDVSLVNIDFSPEFNQAIEQKQVAEQDAKRAVFVAVQAENDATARINKAKGESEAQRLQQQSLTPELLQKMAIERWNGTFPTYYGGGALPFINIK